MENKYKLSVLVPSIRPDNLAKLYNSISDACRYPNSWEMIVISPYPLPEYLKNFDNVQYLYSLRSPLACQQQGLCIAQGTWISWCADDGECLPKSYDIAIKRAEEGNYKTVITGRYQEGPRVNDNMEKEDYYILNNHVQSSGFFIPEKTYMLNCGIVSRQILLELGGWDSERFQHCPIGYNDMAIRLKKYSCEVILQNEPMFQCSHLPGLAGDHAPCHIAQTLYDEIAFKELYWGDSVRVAVALDNWKCTPERWKLRFGEEI